MVLKPSIGIGLRYPHYQQILEELPAIDWLEVHSENFFYSGGPGLALLLEIRKHYPISLHGVGLSLGSASGLDKTHLNRLKKLIKEVDPFFVSEHLSWSLVSNKYLPDLLPIPYNATAFNLFCTNLAIAQDFLGQEILLENPSSYIEYTLSDYSEVDFLVAICQKTGAKLLLDINNIFVSCINHGWNAKDYINSIPSNLVKEFHLAGHSRTTIGTTQPLLIDTHDRAVCPEVWELYTLALKRFGLLPTLLEWDTQIPPLEQLVQEALKAFHYIPLDRAIYVTT